MKRIGAVLLSVVLLLACAVPIGAYHWSGESFLEDYYGVSPLFFDFDVGSFGVGTASNVQSVVSGDLSRTFLFDSFSEWSNDTDFQLYRVLDESYMFAYPAGITIKNGLTIDSSYDSLSIVFTFDHPVKSFTLSGKCTFGLYFYFYSPSSSAHFGFSPTYPSADLLVDDRVVFSSSVSNFDFSHGRSFSFSEPVDSFVIRFSSGSASYSVPVSYCFSGIACGAFINNDRATPFDVKVDEWADGETPGPVDPDPPDPPGPVDPDPPDPIVPGEGDFAYTVVEGEALSKDITLSSSTRTGGASVHWIYDSYEAGNPSYPITVPGGSSLSMAPSRFPSISVSASGGTVTASIPSTSYSFSWSGEQRVDSFVNLLTGPPGFSGPGSAAHDYLVFQFPLSSEDEIHNIELDGFVPVETSYHAGSNSASRVGGAWSLYVNEALAVSGTTDISGNIQFNNFVYHSSEPITTLELRLVPTAAGLAFPSNTGSITFSWSISLGFKGLSMIYTEGEDSAVDLSKLYGQINDAQDSIHDYETIENQWIDNMSSNWDALKLDTFDLDNGLVSGFSLLTGIFNDIWTAFGIFNVVWVVPLMLGIALLVIGRISRSGGSGKGSE